MSNQNEAKGLPSGTDCGKEPPSVPADTATHLRVHIGVDADQHTRPLAHLGRRRLQGAVHAHTMCSCLPGHNISLPATNLSTPASAIIHQATTHLDVGQVKLRVHIDEHAVLHCQLQLARQLAVAIEYGPADEPAALRKLALLSHWSSFMSIAKLAALIGAMAGSTPHRIGCTPGGVKARHHGQPQLVAAHKHRAAAQLAQALQRGQGECQQ